MIFTLKKVRLQNLQLSFIVTLRIFDLECHGQTVKVALVELVMFDLIFMKFRKLRSLYRENKKLNLHKTLIFSLFKSFSILLASSIGQNLFLKNWSISTQPRSQWDEGDWYKLLKIAWYFVAILMFRWCTQFDVPLIHTIWCSVDTHNLLFRWCTQFDILLIHTICCALWNLEEYKVLLPIIILCWMFYY